jgi:hypothetical protein
VTRRVTNSEVPRDYVTVSAAHRRMFETAVYVISRKQPFATERTTHMTNRKRPELPKALGKREWDHDHDIQLAVKEQIAFLNDEGSEPNLAPFTDDEITYILDQAERQTQFEFDPAQFRKAMEKTRPAMSMPKLSNLVYDLWLAVAQPEMLELFWPYWKAGDEGTRGPKASFLFTKAMLAMATFLGKSSHMLQNHAILASNAALRAVFEWTEEQASSAVGESAATLTAPSYKSSLKHIPRLSSESMWLLAMRVNVLMVRALHKLLKIKELRLLIDGTNIDAWCEQSYKGKTPKEETRRRGRTPRAAARVYYGDQVNEEGVKVKTIKKFWRGYYLIALVDQATGRPVVWTLWNADWDEAKALKELLFRLLEFWPDAPVSMVVGDSAWDESWAYKLCADYGIHLIAHRTKHALSHAPVFLNPSQSKTVGAIDRTGLAYCRRHNPNRDKDGNMVCEKPMKYSSCEFGSKRIRFVCDHGPDACGRLSLPMDIRGIGGRKKDDEDSLISWKLLTYYPTTMDGRPDLQAMRVAMLARRNQVESLFSSLKVSAKVGLSGASRTRIIDFDSIRMMLSMAMLMRTAFALAAVRIEKGEFDAMLPDELEEFANVA